MKGLNTFFTAAVLLLVMMTGCQKDDNYFVKEEAFSVITSGFNGSDSELEMVIDTLTLRSNIVAGTSFKVTNKYTFPAGKQSVKLLIRERETGTMVYERDVKRGEYSLTVDLIYVGGKLIDKPVTPVDNPAGIRLVSYLFLPRISGYTGDIDVAYFRKFEYVEDGQLKLEKIEELARITAKPYTFSPFLQAPSFQSGRNEIDGKVYYINPVVAFFKSGTNIPYYEGTGYDVGTNLRYPLPFNAKPQVLGIIEAGALGGTYIENFQTVQF